LLGLLILLEGCGGAEFLDLLLPGGDVADTRLWSKRTILLLGSHRWLGLRDWLWLRAWITSFEARLASGARAIVPVTAMLGAAIKGLAQKAECAHINLLLYGI
jgi:hypothetical protein